jgi:hypothetical protein
MSAGLLSVAHSVLKIGCQTVLFCLACTHVQVAAAFAGVGYAIDYFNLDKSSGKTA